MHIVVGWLLGALVGGGAWWAAGRFWADQVPPAQGRRRLWGPFTVPALAALACLSLWGAYVAWQGSGWAVTVLACALTGVLLALSLVDFRVRRLPNPLLLALLGCGLAQMLWLGQPSPPSAALGLAVGGGVFLLLAFLGRGAMGAGDVKLAAALGFVLGWRLVLPALFYGVLAGGLAALLLLALRRAGRKDPMAYGPYLALGGWLVWTRAAGLWP